MKTLLAGSLSEAPQPPLDISTEWVEVGGLAGVVSALVLALVVLAFVVSLVVELGYAKRGG